MLTICFGGNFRDNECVFVSRTEVSSRIVWSMVYCCLMHVWIRTKWEYWSQLLKVSVSLTDWMPGNCMTVLSSSLRWYWPILDLPIIWCNMCSFLHLYLPHRLRDQKQIFRADISRAQQKVRVTSIQFLPSSSGPNLCLNGKHCFYPAMDTLSSE